jgi:nucleoside-diphosphate-sugar epimerase
MRIFIAGASGAIGRRLVPMLVQRGHTVTGTTRTPDKVGLLRSLGAEPVIIDALDRAQVMRAVADAQPHVVVHQLTAIGGRMNLRNFDAYFAGTNRLRTEGTDHLLAASQAAGVRRFVAQSYTGWTNIRAGGPVKTEDDPFDLHPPANSRQSMAAIRQVESTVASAPLEGVVLRYANLYGPGNALSADGDIARMLRTRQLPVVGGGTGVWSFVHVDDAASATVIAAESGPTGLFTIADDDPAPVGEWLPYLADALGAPRPLRVPAWLVRPLLGEHGIVMMTTARGSSNAKARKEMGWEPAYSSWRQGFREGLR